MINEDDPHIKRVKMTLNQCELLIEKLEEVKDMCYAEIRKYNSAKHTVDAELLKIREEISALIQLNQPQKSKTTLDTQD